MSPCWHLAAWCGVTVQDVTVGEGAGKRLGVKEDVEATAACQPQGDSGELGVSPCGVKWKNVSPHLLAAPALA